MIDSFILKCANPRGPSRSLSLGAPASSIVDPGRVGKAASRGYSESVRPPLAAARRLWVNSSRRRGRRARGCARHWTRIEREVRDGEDAIASTFATANPSCGGRGRVRSSEQPRNRVRENNAIPKDNLGGSARLCGCASSAGPA